MGLQNAQLKRETSGGWTASVWSMEADEVYETIKKANELEVKNVNLEVAADFLNKHGIDDDEIDMAAEAIMDSFEDGQNAAQFGICGGFTTTLYDGYNN